MVFMGDRVLIAMSGGVDSSFAAARLLDQGYEVQGIYMKLWGGDRRGSSCSTADHLAAQAAADYLDIPLHTVDWTARFEQQVIAPFIDGVARAEIGNSCISCNRQFKIKGLVEVADQLGIHLVATGHYAQVKNRDEHPGLYRAVDPNKDQSYVMWMVSTNTLERLILPNGGLHKTDIRKTAVVMGLPAAVTPDSMELCFDPKQMVRDVMGETPGEIIDSQGNMLGL